MTSGMKEISEVSNTLYYCDPELNTACSKKNCYINGGICESTRNIQYAKKPVEKLVLVLPMSQEEFDELKKGEQQ